MRLTNNKSMIRILIICIAVTLISLFSRNAYAAKVDTIACSSGSMHKYIKVVVIMPEGTGKRHFPVLYLLHGAGGGYDDWVKHVPEVIALSQQYGLIIVCPDGNKTSWYLDSPVDSAYRYETFITKELVPFVDSHYPTIVNAAHRGITGLSMGGFGAFYLAIRHPELFGTMGSMSGGLDIRPFPNNWDLPSRLGAYATFPENWDRVALPNLISELSGEHMHIIFDCGEDDFFFKVNMSFHALLDANNIPHDFITRPGKHNWDYWKNAIAYQVLFMHNSFEMADLATKQ